MITNNKMAATYASSLSESAEGARQALEKGDVEAAQSWLQDAQVELRTLLEYVDHQVELL